MKEFSEQEFKEKRSEVRQIVDRYFSVEFSVPGLDLVYQFKLWDISEKGMCILIREDSDVIPRLKEGDTISMDYQYENDPAGRDRIDTEVIHITPCHDGKYRGHCMVGLRILKGVSNPLTKTSS